MASVMSQSPDEPASAPLDPHAPPAVEVRASAVGKGVFAIAPIEAGEAIDEVVGKIFSDPDYSSDYCIDLGGDYSLEPVAPYRFLNHSCEPNAELIQHASPVAGGIASMWLYSTRAIAPGDEITIDYSWPACAAIACLCGSPKCRGWIVDPAELKQLKGKKPRKRKRSKQ